MVVIKWKERKVEILILRVQTLPMELNVTKLQMVMVHKKMMGLQMKVTQLQQ